MKMRCNCNHEFQDKEHGKNVRVHNKKGTKDEVTCTVCGSVKSSKG